MSCNKCVHPLQAYISFPQSRSLRSPISQKSPHERPQKESQRQESQQKERQQSALVDASLLLIIFYYFTALCINAELYNINHTALDEDTLLSLLDWRQYFFNAGVIALSCLAFIAAIPGKVTAVEKLLSLTFFASIAMSALKYDMHGNGLSMIDKLDVIAQEGITAILSILSAYLICRLLRLIQ